MLFAGQQGAQVRPAQAFGMEQAGIAPFQRTGQRRRAKAAQRPGAADAAQHERTMSEAQFETMKNMTLWNLKDLLVKVQAAERLIQLYRTSVIPQAENALKVTQAAYQSDRAGFLDLIDVQRNLVQFKLEHYQHLADYRKNLAELEQIVGQPFSEVSK